MKRTLIFSAIVFLFFSCGKKKRQVLEYGTTSFDGINFSTQLYTEHDSIFEEFRESSSNRIFLIKKSDTEKNFRDSTYAEDGYYENGNVKWTKYFSKRIPIGTWIKYYSDGKKESASKFENGKLSEVNMWWENGNLNVESKYASDGKMIHNEYFENGNPAQKLEIDSMGTGKCTNFYTNGQKREEGNVYRKSPSGMWIRFDSLGNKMRDTLLGFPKLK